MSRKKGRRDRMMKDAARAPAWLRDIASSKASYPPRKPIADDAAKFISRATRRNRASEKRGKL